MLNIRKKSMNESPEHNSHSDIIYRTSGNDMLIRKYGLMLLNRKKIMPLIYFFGVDRKD